MEGEYGCRNRLYDLQGQTGTKAKQGLPQTINLDLIVLVAICSSYTSVYSADRLDFDSDFSFSYWSFVVYCEEEKAESVDREYKKADEVPDWN